MDEGTTDVDVVRAVVEEMVLHLPTEKRGEARARLYAVWTVYKGMSEAEWRGKMAEEVLLIAAGREAETEEAR